MKVKTINYTLEPMDRRFNPVHHKSLFSFWSHKLKNLYNTINDKLEPYVTNGRKYDSQQRMKAYCRDFNSQRRTVHNAWTNPNPYIDNTQQLINDIKFGRL